MIFLSAQPDDLYFLWQLEVQLHNFKRMGIDPRCIHVLLGVKPGQGLKTEFRSLVCRDDLARFFIYPDARTTPLYVPGIRPHIIKQHLKKYPLLNQEAIFYHDSDIIFRELPDWEEMEAGDTWYVSDARNYLDSRYIMKHGPNVLDDMCGIVGIGKERVIAADDHAGGAQYILKGTDYAFWDKVEHDGESLYSRLQGGKTAYATAWAEQTGKDQASYIGIQDWCADMWALLWNGLLRGCPVRISTDLGFSWPITALEKWQDFKIFHNAGIDKKQRKKHFCKVMYDDKLPYFEDFSSLDKTTCSVKYVEEIHSSARSLKYDLTDTTILIPLRIDSADRMDNLRTILRFFDTWFDTNIMVLEADIAPRLDKAVLTPGVEYHFLYDDRPYFYHTLYNNWLIDRCITPYAAIYDADVVMPPNQLFWAVEHLRHEGAGLVYPYDGDFYFVNRGLSKLFRQQLNFGILNNYRECHFRIAIPCYGGACVLDLDIYRRLGKDNLRLEGWGPEDQERHKRFIIAGEKVKRVGGPIFHLDHFREKTSRWHSETLERHNKFEFLRICNMTRSGLQEYINKAFTNV